MSIAEDRKPMPSIQNPNLTPGVFGEAQVVSQTSSSHPKEQPSPSPSPVKKLPASPKDAIIAVAARVAAQPLPCSDPEVWGVLTAISNLARKRSQGINILLTADVHILGRLVEDVRFQLESAAVSQRHCEISRKVVPKEDVESPSGFCNSTFLKDTSTNGTYLNWERLKRGHTKFEAKLCHGDIISFAAPPQHEQAIAFVYREVSSSIPSSNANVLKRKAEESTPENKRPKGIGLGAPEGPISLNDFRSLQRSNEDLRKQLENQVRTIDELKNENREAIEHHQNEMEELRDSISKPYLTHLRKEQEKAAEELKRALRREREQQLAAREEAWGKISDLKLVINAALQDLEGSREKIMLRETHLRAFYSTTEEIQKLFSKQQEQLKAMQRTLEDEDNDENDGFSLHTVSETVGGEAPGVTEAIGYRPRLMF